MTETLSPPPGLELSVSELAVRMVDQVTGKATDLTILPDFKPDGTPGVRLGGREFTPFVNNGAELPDGTPVRVFYMPRPGGLPGVGYAPVESNAA